MSRNSIIQKKMQSMGNGNIFVLLENNQAKVKDIYTINLSEHTYFWSTTSFFDHIYGI